MLAAEWAVSGSFQRLQHIVLYHQLITFECPLLHIDLFKNEQHTIITCPYFSIKQHINVFLALWYENGISEFIDQI
ncbi:hypothetical protein LY11_00604 [Pedobacter cryoconitis]|uniref:Uncharacterized protein n=1 Tax=Pedobacter cryoconitis TaxID=188932 RepID=A0A327T294_9SPHI|nr:hypothetical protein LY11_00604 [Pedobacter cryoconitis]